MKALAGSLLAAVIATTAFAPIVGANGNYSHVWIANDALTYLPAGEVKDALADPHLVNIVKNGAYFPDGGYAVNDGYGELSHWEPLQSAYLEWIRATYAPPWSAEALEHIAFLFGMAAHGMADQLYDGIYLERHEAFDPPGCGDDAVGGVDGLTDACFAADMGPLVKPTPWVPAEALAPLYLPLGHEVTAQKIKQGHNLVPFAIVKANADGANPDTIAGYLAACPWACGHQDDPAAPGSPVTNGPAVAAYWQVLWGRLHGHQVFDEPLLGAFFTGGQPWSYPTDAGSPDAWVSFALPRGLEPSTVTDDTVRVTRDDDGSVHATHAKVYYGYSSHLVNVRPEVDWAAEASYTVTIAPPITSWDGAVLSVTHTVLFATFPNPNPPEPEPEAVEVAEALPEPVEPAPESSEPAPEATEVPPEVVEPPPDVAEPAPELVEAMPDAPPAADVSSADAPAADVPAADAAPADGSSDGGGGCDLAGTRASRSVSLVLMLSALLGLIAARAVRRA